jgi:PAS domain S-box-containing protein
MKKGVDSLYPLILDSITEGVFTVNDGFRITSFNSEAERIIGIDREAAIGRKCHEVFRATICQSTCAMRRTIDTREPQRNVRIDVLNARMEPVPILVSTAVLRGRGGKLLGGVEIFRDVSELEVLRKELSGRHEFGDMVGVSKPMLDLFRILPDVALSDSPVLIQGASGTGKEMVAQALHNLSLRKDGPYVRVNCGALPDTLLESEMFGHEKGAFTGATSHRPGRFREAHRGTLLLDEVGELSPAFQVKLLRVLEDGEVQPLGSTGSTRVDVRILAATNRNLGALIREGRFRQDLYFRLGVVPITIPPLALRRNDIPVLAGHILKRLALRMGRDVPRLTPEAMKMLYDHDFPGNVRELENILERALVLGHSSVIDVDDLPPELRGIPQGVAPATRGVEARRLLEVLEANRWNRTMAARELGIARNTLWRRMKKHGLT